MSFSFNFSKKARASTIKDSILRDDSTKPEEEREYVHTIEGNQFKGSSNSSSASEKRELTIPLITKNNWRQENENAQSKQKASKRDRDNYNSCETEFKPKKSKDEDLTFNTNDNLTKQAIKELLGSAGESTNIPNKKERKIPLQKQDKLGVSRMLDSSSLEDYERVPIEDFGMAMLRGMNWKKEEGIGLTNKSYVELIEPQPRARGLGLGATKRLDSSEQS